jgi:manganese/zinc/iron transport system permease protein
VSGIAALLQSSIVQTVALGAAMLGVTSGALGAFALMRRQSLMGDTLSHAALPGICLGFLWAGARDLGAILVGAFLAGALAALTVMLIGRRTRLKTDAALSIVLSVYFAVGVVLLTHVQASAGAAQAGLSTFLFGQAAAILATDLPVMAGVAAVALGLVAVFWKEFKLVTFDDGFARAQGLPVLALEAALTVMVALAIVVGLQMVGVVLMVAMLIAPAAAARQWTRSLGAMVVLSAGFGALAGVSGAVISASVRGLPTGPVVVLAASALAGLSLLLAPERGLVWQWIEAGRQRRGLAARRVLMTIHGLGRAHGDPAYAAEAGMLDAFHGTATAPALQRLQAEGLVHEVAHPPDSATHWALTDAGRDTATALARAATPEATGPQRSRPAGAP